MTLALELRMAVRCDGIDAGVLRPVGFRVREAMSAPYEIEIDVAPDGEFDGASLLRKGVELLVLDQNDALVRRFEGVAASVTETFRGAGVELRIVVRSPMFALSLSSDCRIFQAQSAPDVVKSVLTSCGVSKVQTKLSATYVVRDSITQYGQTMFDFVSWLLEDEGISYFFEEASDGLNVVLAYSATGAAKISGKVQFTADAGAGGIGCVRRAVDVVGLRPGKVTLRDLSWQKPALDLEATATDTTAGGTKREHYAYPGGYDDAGEGKRRAKSIQDAFTSQTSFVRMTSDVAQMSAGHSFELEGSDTHDGEWIVKEVTHTWRLLAGTAGSAGYSNELTAFKKTAPFAPARKTPRPRIDGLHTAVVTGPDGKEIHTDEHGRVKLKFPWDRHAKFDDKSSAWARVAEVPLTGSMHVPRIGWEVVVEFEHGDPDRPVVVGRLFNARYVPPYALPANKTKSVLGSYSSPGGKGHNEIRIEDAAGSEHIHVHAQKDYTLNVAEKRDVHITTSSMTTVKVDQTVHVKKDRTAEVKGKSDLAVSGNQTMSVAKDRTKTVKGDEHVTVVGDASLTVGGAHTLDLKKRWTLQTGGDATFTVAGDLAETADEAIRVLVGDDAEINVGGAKSEIAKQGKSVTVGGKLEETVGAAMSVTSQQDLSVRVKGKKTSSLGGALSATSGADLEISSSDALEITAGAALSLTGASGVTFKVGGSKLTVAAGGVVIDASKVKITSDGPLSQLGALVLSK
jgi:type VI secretion system secreted protein VgrG